MSCFFTVLIMNVFGLQNNSYTNVPLTTSPTINATDRDTGAGKQNLTYDIVSGLCSLYQFHAYCKL